MDDVDSNIRALSVEVGRSCGHNHRGISGCVGPYSHVRGFGRDKGCGINFRCCRGSRRCPFLLHPPSSKGRQAEFCCG